jgi:predicted nucleic acid-binding Zn ribbon protein
LYRVSPELRSIEYIHLMSASKAPERICLECLNTVYGREDKKFCSDHCRNTFNNRENKQVNALIRVVTARLKKNRKILLDLNPSGKRRVSREELLKLGFSFEYFTNVYITVKEKKEYRYCFDQGYLEIAPGSYILVHKKEWES